MRRERKPLRIAGWRASVTTLCLVATVSYPEGVIAQEKNSGGFFDSDVSSSGFFGEKTESTPSKARIPSYTPSSRPPLSLPASHPSQVGSSVGEADRFEQPEKNTQQQRRAEDSFGNAFAGPARPTPKPRGSSVQTTDAERLLKSGDLQRELPSSKEISKRVTSVMDQLKTQVDKGIDERRAPKSSAPIAVPEEFKLPKPDSFDLPVPEGIEPRSSKRSTSTSKSTESQQQESRLTVPSEGSQGPVLSVIVSGESEQHAARVLDRLFFAKSKLGVTVGEVLIIGGPENAMFSILGKPAAMNAVKEAIKENIKKEGRPVPSDRQIETEVWRTAPLLSKSLGPLQLTRSFEVTKPSEFIKRYNPQVSPTWVVHTPDLDYVYPGEWDVMELFREGGEFQKP